MTDKLLKALNSARVALWWCESSLMKFTSGYLAEGVDARSLQFCKSAFSEVDRVIEEEKRNYPTNRGFYVADLRAHLSQLRMGERGVLVSTDEAAGYNNAIDHALEYLKGIDDDMPIDRGAWANVENATKLVEEQQRMAKRIAVLEDAAKQGLKAFEVATTHFARDRQEILAAISALRQALDQSPGTTQMIDAGVDRGAWSDVPDATKWVDELRGDDDEWDHPPQRDCNCPQCKEYWSDVVEPPNSTTDVVEPIGEIIEAHGLIAVSIPAIPPAGTKLYAAPPKPDLLKQTCCECGRSGGYALYCGDCWDKATRREWQGLNSEEKTRIRDSVPYTQFMSAGEYAMKVQHATEAELREKNT